MQIQPWNRNEELKADSNINACASVLLQTSTLVLQQPAPTQGNWGWSQEQLLSSLWLLRLLNEWSDNNPGGTSSLLTRALAIISPLHIPAVFSRDLTAWGYWLRSHSLVRQVLVNLFFPPLHLNTDKKQRQKSSKRLPCGYAADEWHSESRPSGFQPCHQRKGHH